MRLVAAVGQVAAGEWAVVEAAVGLELGEVCQAESEVEYLD